jgi:hypothetical protein
LNKNGNILESNKETTIEIADGSKIKHKFGDKPYSRTCDYRPDCYYNCNWEVPKNEKLKINEDTYNLIFAKSDIEQAKKYIKNMFKKNIIYNLEYIVQDVKKKIPTIENKYIYKALDEMVKNKNEIVYDKLNREGYVIYRGKYYIFQPKEITYESIPLYYRDIPITSKTKKIQILDHVKEQIYENKIVGTNLQNDIENKIKTYAKQLENTIKNNKISIDDSFEAILGLVLDRINENDTINLLKKLIGQHNKKELKNSLDEKILGYYVDNLFLDSLVTDKKKKLSSEILGFRYHNKYYCIKNNVWSMCNDNIRKKLELFDKVLSKKEKKQNVMVGLISYNKKKEVIFSIIDRKKYKTAYTLDERKSLRTEITGRVCETYNLETIHDIRSEIKMKDAEHRNKKPSLCLEIEFFMRYKNNIDDTKKWIEDEVKK